MAKQYKIAIIGAGINGLYLAWKLAEQGHQVVLFEKKPNPFGKICSGLISARIKNFVPLDEKVFLNRIEKCFINYPRKRVELAMAPLHFVVDRDHLNQILWDSGRRAGVQYLFEHEISQLPDKDFDRIVLCNGGVSKLGERPEMVTQSFYLGLQFFEEKKDYKNHVETWAHESGFFWKIPRGSNVEWGVLGASLGLINKFRGFCKEKLIVFPEDKIQSAIIPQGLRIIGRDKVANCGDAAGLCKPWSGGGVIWGLTAADMLIRNIDNLAQYEKEAREFFAPLVFKGEIARKAASFVGFNTPFLMPSKVRRDNDFPIL